MILLGAFYAYKLGKMVCSLLISNNIRRYFLRSFRSNHVGLPSLRLLLAPSISFKETSHSFSSSAYKNKSFQHNTLPEQETMSGCKCSDKKDKLEASDKIMGPLERALYEKITSTLNPETLTIRNDSWKHAHHTGMKGVENVTESHFHVTIVSRKFSEPGLKSALARHRYIFKLLDQEIKGGIHGFQVVCKTPEEWEKLQQGQKEKSTRASSEHYFS